MTNTDNNFEIPAFMSKGFFEKTLKSGLGFDNVDIEDLKISNASAIGENYSSKIFRVQIKYHELSKTSQEISLIVKSMIMIGSVNKISEEGQVFQKETMMYKKIIPQIEKLYKNVESIAPKCFYVENEPTHQVIVLQDLQASGYTLADRIKRLDEEHSKILLRKLGRYHAGTIVLYQNKPNIFKIFNNGFYQNGNYEEPPFRGLFKEGIEQFIEYVSEWKDFEEITEKLKSVLKNYKEMVLKCLSSTPNEIRVLNHSDVWINNLMFKYNKEKVCDMKFIDLQISTNGSLGLDIHYCLNMCVDFDLLENKRDKLLRHYYDAFEGGLRELNYQKIPSWDDVQNEIKSREFFGFMIAVGLTPMIILDRELSKDSTFETVMNSDMLKMARALIYSSERYQKFIKHSLKRFDKLGVFD